MIRSMTGYGQAQARAGAFQCLAEIRSVNHRYLDLSVRMPVTFSIHEQELRERIAGKVKRGKLNLFVSLNGSEDPPVTVDTTRLKRYVRSIRQIAKELKLDGRLSLPDLLHMPNALSSVQSSETVEPLWPKVLKVIDRAVDRLLQMRTREGARLQADVAKRLGRMQSFAETIRTQARLGPALFKEKFEKRLASLTGESVEIEPALLAKEAALFAERTDITEELVRFGHHISFFGTTLKGKGEIGKRLDFITQEMHREVNTMGSKANDFLISKQVVAIKAELEKVREQIQNIE